jgi:hypothetical protein
LIIIIETESEDSVGWTGGVGWNCPGMNIEHIRRIISEKGKNVVFITNYHLLAIISRKNKSFHRPPVPSRAQPRKERRPYGSYGNTL